MLEAYTKESYKKRLMEANKEFGLSNDYLEGKKDYKDMSAMEQVDINNLEEMED